MKHERSISRKRLNSIWRLPHALGVSKAGVTKSKELELRGKAAELPLIFGQIPLQLTMAG
jgi:hypothetical protein